jgi:hypothetical protein
MKAFKLATLMQATGKDALIAKGWSTGITMDADDDTQFFFGNK